MKKPAQVVLLTLLVIGTSLARPHPHEPRRASKPEVRAIAEAIIAREEGFWDAWRNKWADFFKANMTDERITVAASGRKGKSQVVEEVLKSD